ncbi:MAG TPA: VWA domain-containing protein, partial [Pyrinomonadaceae bacterium]
SDAAAATQRDEGRTVIFFVDDIHLADHSTVRVRKSLLRFVDEQMREGDQVLLFTTTGQLGFLQQFTTDKELLRLAINRLAYKAAERYERGEWRVSMDEYQALRIERHDRQVLEFFAAEVAKELLMPSPGPSRATANSRRAAGSTSAPSYIERIVYERARSILQQAAASTRATLRTLENLVRAVAPLPGRKLLLFASDGFLVENPNGNASEEMRRVSDAAAHSGTVVYSIEARGLVTGVPDASERQGFSLTGMNLEMKSFANTKAQEPLSSLASMTGGRALLNSNDLNLGFKEGLSETSEYYLLAWQPAGGAGASNKFRRVEVGVKGRPELRVRVRQGFFGEPPPPPDAAADAKRTPTERLFDALRSVTPVRQLPTSLGAGFVNDPAAGMVLVVSLEVDAATLGVARGAGAQAEVDVAAAVVNLDGKNVNGFEQSLLFKPDATPDGGGRRVVYTRQLKVAPGRYQLRAAARDRRTGRAGSALRWVEVPDIKPGRLSLSSIFVGEVAAGGAGRKLEPQADARFARGSRLGFLVYVYNAALSAGRPDVALQVNVFRDKEVVVSLPLLRLNAVPGADAARMPFGEEVSLE